MTLKFGFTINWVLKSLKKLAYFSYYLKKNFFWTNFNLFLRFHRWLRMTLSITSFTAYGWYLAPAVTWGCFNPQRKNHYSNGKVQISCTHKQGCTHHRGCSSIWISPNCVFVQAFQTGWKWAETNVYPPGCCYVLYLSCSDLYLLEQFHLLHCLWALFHTHWICHSGPSLAVPVPVFFCFSQATWQAPSHARHSWSL